MNGKIKVIFDKKPDGSENITTTGKYFVTVLIEAKDETVIYDKFYFTEKAYFRVDQVFKSVGVEAPAWSDDMTFEKFTNLLKMLVGYEVNFATRKNDNNWTEIAKYYPKPEEKEVKAEPVSNDTEKKDPDLDEEIPF